MRVAVVAILAVVTGLFTAAPSGHLVEAQAGSVVRAKLNGEPVRLTLPTVAGDPKGLVLWFHGQGGNVNNRIESPFLSALTSEGFAIASSDFHRGSWGNPASTDDTLRLTAWAEKQVGAPVVLWVSGSMGGSTSLNAMLHGVTPPPCWYGVKPAISLNRMNAVPQARRLIKAAYDGAVPRDRDPVRNIARLPSDIRYRVVVSPDDQWVPIDQNGGALVSTLDKLGVDVTYRFAEGPHKDPSHFDPADLVTFAESCVDEPELTSSASK